MIIFLHICKNGSQTLRQNLRRRGVEITYYHKGIDLPNCQFLSVDIDDIDDFYDWHRDNPYPLRAIVRNPFERFISGWHFCIKMKWIESLSPLQFLKLLDSYRWRDPQGHIWRHAQLRQTEYFRLDDPAQIVKIENLDNLLIELYEHFDIVDHTIDHNNVSIEKPLVSDLVKSEPELLDLHYDLFKADWTMLPYDFECYKRLVRDSNP